MAPPPPRELLAVVEAALLSPAPPSPAQRVELLHALRDAAPAFRALLSYPVRPASLVRELLWVSSVLIGVTLILASLPSVRVQGPKASDRTQVEAKEVRLPDMPPITLDDTDVQTVSFPPSVLIYQAAFTLCDVLGATN
jgi:nuclear pore complex protein Nup205